MQLIVKQEFEFTYELCISSHACAHLRCDWT